METWAARMGNREYMSKFLHQNRYFEVAIVERQTENPVQEINIWHALVQSHRSMKVENGK